MQSFLLFIIVLNFKEFSDCSILKRYKEIQEMIKNRTWVVRQKLHSVAEILNVTGFADKNVHEILTNEFMACEWYKIRITDFILNNCE